MALIPAKHSDRNAIPSGHMRSAYHNLPLINGVEQQAGARFAAKDVSFVNSSKSAVFKADITSACPADAQLGKWERTYTLNRHRSFTISDKYSLLTNKGNNALHFMTSAVIEKKKDGILQFNTGTVAISMEYDPKIFGVQIEPIQITDKKTVGKLACTGFQAGA